MDQIEFRAPSTAAGSIGMIDSASGADRPRVFPCDGCGAWMEFHVGRQSLRCEFCGFVKSIDIDPAEAVEEQDFRAMLGRAAVVELPTGLPEGWDLADPWPAGVDTPTASERVAAAFRMIASTSQPRAEAACTLTHHPN